MYVRAHSPSDMEVRTVGEGTIPKEHSEGKWHHLHVHANLRTFPVLIFHAASVICRNSRDIISNNELSSRREGIMAKKLDLWEAFSQDPLETRRDK